MAQAQGSSSRICFAVEGTWGTKPSTSAAGSSILFPFESESLDVDQPREVNPHITSARDYKAGVLGLVDCGGAIEFRLNPNAHNTFWKALVGAPTISAVSSAWSTTFTPQTTLPSYTVEVGFTDINQYFWLEGMRASRATFRVTPAGFLAVSSEWMGQGENASSPDSSGFATPTSQTDNPFDLANANTAINEGGSPIATVTNLEFTVDNELDGSVYVVSGGGERGSLPPGKFRVSGTLTAFFENATLYNKAVNSTESSISVVLQHGTGVGTAGNEKCTITIPEILYARRKPKVEGATGVVWEGPFEAYYDDASEGASFEVVVLNAISAVE